MSKLLNSICGKDEFRVAVVSRVVDSAPRHARVVRRVKDGAENFDTSKILDLIRKAEAAGFKIDGSMSMGKVAEAAKAFLKEKGEKVGDSRTIRRVVRDSRSYAVRRVKDDATQAELKRFAKEDKYWELYNTDTPREEIRTYFDDSHYAAIRVDSKDKSYEVRFGGFSDKIDAETVRHYTDLADATKFAYARGMDFMKREGDTSVKDSRLNGCVARRRSIKDSRIVRRVRDGRFDTAPETLIEILKGSISDVGVEGHVKNITIDGNEVFADWVYGTSDDDFSVLLSFFPESWSGAITITADEGLVIEKDFTGADWWEICGTMLSLAYDANSPWDLAVDLYRRYVDSSHVGPDYKAALVDVITVKDSRTAIRGRRIVRDSRGVHRYITRK